MKGWFITGTDTDVGKTALSAGLLCVLRARGVDAVYMKPVQTGCGRRACGGFDAPDLEFVARLSGWDRAGVDTDKLCPYRYEPACSPHLAARLAGERISATVIRRLVEDLGGAHDAILVEGAGGVLVPVNEQETMLDLMRAIGLPVLLAARPSLGTLNHTLLSLRELSRAGLRVDGVVFVRSQPGPWTRIERENRRAIESMGGTSVRAVLPYFKTWPPTTVDFRRKVRSALATVP